MFLIRYQCDQCGKQSGAYGWTNWHQLKSVHIHLRFEGWVDSNEFGHAICAECAGANHASVLHVEERGGA
jgi:hypothetical protein